MQPKYTALCVALSVILAGACLSPALAEDTPKEGVKVETVGADQPAVQSSEDSVAAGLQGAEKKAAIFDPAILEKYKEKKQARAQAQQRRQKLPPEDYVVKRNPPPKGPQVQHIEPINTREVKNLRKTEQKINLEREIKIAVDDITVEADGEHITGILKAEGGKPGTLAAWTILGDAEFLLTEPAFNQDGKATAMFITPLENAVRGLSFNVTEVEGKLPQQVDPKKLKPKFKRKEKLDDPIEPIEDKKKAKTVQSAKSPAKDTAEPSTAQSEAKPENEPSVKDVAEAEKPAETPKQEPDKK